MTDQNIDFQIRGIELLESTMKLPVEKLPEKHVFQYDINLEHRLNVPNELVVVTSTVSVFTENKESQLGSIKTSCVFYVAKLEEYFNQEKNALELPREFLINLNSIALSTTRGMMFSTFRGTILHQAVLPLVDPAGMEGRK